MRSGGSYAVSSSRSVIAKRLSSRTAPTPPGGGVPSRSNVELFHGPQSAQRGTSATTSQTFSRGALELAFASTTYMGRILRGLEQPTAEDGSRPRPPLGREPPQLGRRPRAGEIADGAHLGSGHAAEAREGLRHGRGRSVAGGRPGGEGRGAPVLVGRRSEDPVLAAEAHARQLEALLCHRAGGLEVGPERLD